MAKHETQSVIILKKTDVKSIKSYQGRETYYRIELYSNYGLSKQKLFQAARNLLMDPVGVISTINHPELLIQIRDAIDTKLRQLDHGQKN